MSTSTEATLEQPTNSSSSLVIAARILEALIGAVLIFAAWSKAADLANSIKQVLDYKIISNHTLAALGVWLLIAVESALGGALIVGYRRKLFVPATYLMFAVFLSALGWAWYSGATADCGCFGSWVKHTPQQALMYDLGFMIVLTIAQIFTWRQPQQKTVSQLGLIALTVVLGLGVAGYASLTPPQQPNLFQSLKVTGLTTDFRKGTIIFVVMDTGCTHCQANTPKFNQLFDNTATLPPLVAVCPNSELEIKDFQRIFKPKFPLGVISNDDFFSLLKGGDTPRVFLLKDSKILKIWDVEAPSEAEIKASLL